MKLNYLSLGIILITLMLVSCGTAKKLVEQQNDVEVIVPCSGIEFMSNGELFRASAMGLSTSMDIASQKAMTSARTKLAQSIQVKVQNVTESFASSYETNQQEEAKSRFNTMTLEAVQQQLTGIKVICQKTMKDPQGRYKVYVAIELSGEEISEAMMEKISNDDKLRVDFEYEKFQSIFKEEMKKMEKEQQ